LERKYDDGLFLRAFLLSFVITAMTGTPHFGLAQQYAIPVFAATVVE
jgi:hypothetical protein